MPAPTLTLLQLANLLRNTALTLQTAQKERAVIAVAQTDAAEVLRHDIEVMYLTHITTAVEDSADLLLRLSLRLP